jgi:Protein kinase domain
MGQTNEKNRKLNFDNHHQRSSTLESAKKKIELNTITIAYKNESKEILVKDSSLTCGWLLSEAIRLFPLIFPIVGLKTFERSDVVDVWLHHFERSVNIIKHGTILVPIIGRKISELVSLEWFDIISRIGKGGFSNVYLVRKKDTGYLYGLKVMQKLHIFEQNKVKQILAECSILKKLSHPFIIQLHWAFQTVL